MLICWSFWVRRTAWNCRWERATSLFVFAMLLTGVFTFHLTADPVGRGLYALTRLHNLGHFFAQVTFLGGICAVVYSAVAKLTTDKEFAQWFKRRVELPLAVGVALDFALFAASKVSDNPHPDFNTMQTTGVFLSAYWLLYSGMLLYLLYHLTRALIDLWHDEPSRKIVNLYLVANGFLATAALLRVITVIVQSPGGSALFYLSFMCHTIAVGILAFAAGWSWQARVRWFRPPRPLPEKEESL